LQGTPGPAGSAGPTGPQGPPGPAGSITLDYNSSSFANPAAGQYGVPDGVDSGEVPCDPGLRVVGGGVQTTSGNQWVNDSYPSNGSGAGGTTAWTGTVVNTGATAESFTVYAICTNP